MLVELTPVFDIVVRFKDFLNIDLHQRGYYHIRSRLKLNPKYGQGKIDVQVPRSAGAVHMFPASVVEGQAVGTTIEILYLDEALALNDVLHFSLALATRVDRLPPWLELFLHLELWFCEKDAVGRKSQADLLAAFRCLAKRCLRLRLSPLRGLHAFRPVLFDYTALAGLTLSVHASLVALKADPRRASPDASPDGGASPPLPRKLAAYHRAACTALLGAYEALQLRTQSLAGLLSVPLRLQAVNTPGKLDALCRRLEEEAGRAWEALEEDRLLLGQELAVLWAQFQQLFLAQAPVHAALAQEHHLARVKRFAEGYFMTEDTLHGLIASIYSSSGQNMGFFTRLTEMCKKSAYFGDLPRLNVHCSELDGESETMPIIFEEKYIHPVSAKTPLRLPSRDGEEGRRLRDSLSLDLPTPHRPSDPPPPVDPTDVFFSSSDEASPSSPLCLSSAGKSHILSSCSEPNLTHCRGDEAGDPGAEEFPKHLSRAHRRRSESDVAGAVPLQFDKSLGPFRPRRSPSKEPLAATENGEADEDENGGEIDLNATTENNGLRCCLPICTSRGDVVASTKAARRGSALLARLRRSKSSSDPDSPVAAAAASSKTSVAGLELQPRLTAALEEGVLEFVTAKEAFKDRLSLAGYSGHLCSDFVRQAAAVPLFLGIPPAVREDTPTHLIVCVHGLDGSSLDLRPYRTFLRQGLPTANLDFLMSAANETETYRDFATLSRNLVDELLLHLSRAVAPARISFVAHSLGNIIVRAALGDPRLEPWLPRLHAYLSLNAPHCGLQFNRAPYDWGLSLVQWWKDSRSLAQLSLRDEADPRASFLYRLSQSPALGSFRYVLLVGSKQDMYVPCHSALVQPCKAAQRDSAAGAVYQEMVASILEGVSSSQPRPTSLLRFTAFHGLTCMSKSHQVLGRAAHIAVLDDELFIEKLLTVSVLQYFA